MRASLVRSLLLGSALALAGCQSAPTAKAPALDEVVRLNQVQVVGTHNSFHRRLPPKLFEILTSFDAKLAASVDYEHAPLDEQLDAGIRQLELDVFADPEGGRFASRAANPLGGLPKETGLAELSEPGFKVLHLPEVDFESSCLSLRTCLRTIASWSDAHPKHLPIMVFVEAKDAPVPDVAKLGFATPLPIGAAELDALDAEIRAVFDADHLLAPDDVRGSHATLREAVTTDGWPTLAASRGKVLFCLLNDDAKRAAYVAVPGRAMFTLSGVDAPESAVVSRPEALSQAADITALARQGFVVRTRADADTVEARSGDVGRRDAALASAATWVSTDFPAADPEFGTDYAVPPAIRCNPVTAPAACRDDRLEP
jgi:hypothetical protein